MRKESKVVTFTCDICQRELQPGDLFFDTEDMGLGRFTGDYEQHVRCLDGADVCSPECLAKYAQSVLDAEKVKESPDAD